MRPERAMDLCGDEWTLVGWVPNTWLWATRQVDGLGDRGLLKYQCTPEMPARVPGAVQDDLRRAGWLPDWNVGLNAPMCEWVEHRHWEYRREIQVPADWEGQHVILRAEGLDYAGHILVDGRSVGEFSGMMVPHEFDLTDWVNLGAAHMLSIVFKEAPAEQGQIGYTSRSRYFKARFAYRWDWCPRMVPLGIWDRIMLLAVAPVRLQGCLPRAEWDLEQGAGRLGLQLDVKAPDAGRLLCHITLLDDERSVYQQEWGCAFAAGRTETSLAIRQPLDVQPWWPNGMGQQKLYRLLVELRSLEGQVLDCWSGRVGFKSITWLQCKGAPANAEPWICEVNGKAVFLAGANWTPVRMTYGSVTRAMYAQRLDLYADMGLNILRVWGGAFLEEEAFYELCDERGLMVWQEFPLSSSGVENLPPDDPTVLGELGEIAASYLWRRGGHASLLVWSGGNELFEQGGGTPVDTRYPAIALMAGIVARLNPGVRFVATSPSGPRFSYDPDLSGQGLHHDVHGPWVMSGTLDEWQAYWSGHDAMLVSEVGVPACASMRILERYAGDFALWPPSIDNPLWRYRQPWWIQWDRLADAHGFERDRDEMARFVALSQQEQADALACLVASCKGRFPRCGGVMIWMGHDCFPCLSNTSIIDFEGCPKPAVAAIKAVLCGGE